MTYQNNLTKQTSELFKNTSNGKLQIFSCRVECLFDIVSFFTVASKSGICILNISIIDDQRGFPDKECEFTSYSSLEELRNCCNELEDSHVLFQTLRPCPLKENSLKRDFSL